MRVAARNPGFLWIAAGWLAVLTGAVVRLRGINQTLFFDELWVVGVVKSGEFVPHAVHHPPLFFFLTLAVTRLFGFGDTSLHAPAAAAGILAAALPLLFRRRSDPLLSPAAAAFCAAFLSFSSPLLFYSTRAKQYTLEALLSLLLIGLFFHAVNTRRLEAYGAVSILAVLVTYTPVFVLAATGLCLIGSAMLAREWRRAASIGALHASMALAFVLAYFGYMKPGAGVTKRVGDLDQFFTSGPAMRFFDGSLRFVTQNTLHWAGEYLNLTRGALLVAAVCLLAAAWRWYRSPLRPHYAYALVVAALPPVLVLAASAFHLYPYGEVRLMAFAAPGVFVLLSLAMAEIASLSRVAAAVLFAMTVSFCVRGVVADPYNRSYLGIHDARPIYEAINQRHRPGIPILARDWEWGPLRYYCSSSAPDIRKIPGDAVSVRVQERVVWVVAPAKQPLFVEGARCRPGATAENLVLSECVK